MSLTTTQQLHQILEEKNHVLVTFRKDGAGDAIGSAVALLLFLEKWGKRAEIVVDEFSLPPQFHFLKRAKDIRPAFAHLQKFILTVDGKKNGVEELSYDMKDGDLHIYITPKRGFFTQGDIRTAQSDFRYDLIIVLNTQDMASLGNIYQNNTDMFYKTPVINIDNDIANEHFGQINLVDITMASTAEVAHGMIKTLGEEYIDADISTALLTGMIAATRSFSGENVKPSTLATAGKLVAGGANRDYIVQNLYRTRSLSTLKLWGQALSRMENDKQTGLVWVSLTREDFVRAGAHETELQDIIDELIRNSPEAKIIALFHEHVAPEHQHQIHAIVNAGNYADASMLLGAYHPYGNKKQAGCLIEGKILKEAETEIVERIKTFSRTNK